MISKMRFRRAAATIAAAGTLGLATAAILPAAADAAVTHAAASQSQQSHQDWCGYNSWECGGGWGWHHHWGGGWGWHHRWGWHHNNW